MAINATNSGNRRELIPSGNYIARCFQMIEIGTITENILGQNKILQKVRIGWELPTELRVFREEKGEQPLAISKDFTLSMNEKANLRKMLASWRGKDFTEDEAKNFDITKLIGVPCMLNIIHKTAKSGSVYEDISSVSAIPKGLQIPPAINPVFILSYDNFDKDKFESLPDFIKDKMKGSLEFAAMLNPGSKHVAEDLNSDTDDLPF